MAIAPIPNTALQGLQRGIQGVRRSASEIARVEPTGSNGDFSREIVEMKQHANQARASSRAVKAYNETLGTLLDIRA